MALTNWNDILNKPKGIDEVPEIALTVEQLSASVTEIALDVSQLSASVLSLGEDVTEIALDVSQLSASVLSIGEDVEELKPKVIASFTKDGTTTYAEALAGMFNNQINERSVLIIDSGANKNYHHIYRLTSTLAWFTSCVYSGGHGFINTLQVQPTGSVYQAIDFNVSAGTMTTANESTSVAENMQIINL